MGSSCLIDSGHDRLSLFVRLKSNFSSRCVGFATRLSNYACHCSATSAVCYQKAGKVQDGSLV